MSDTKNPQQGLSLPDPEAHLKPLGVLGLNGVLGIGTDLVFVPAFAEQLNSPGSKFGEPGVTFSTRELRRASTQGVAKGDGTAVHLAAVWAIKEAVIKAWVSTLAGSGTPAPIEPDGVNWSEIQVRHSPGGVPSVELSGDTMLAFQNSVSDSNRAEWHVSASHDGDYAIAFAVLTK